MASHLLLVLLALLAKSVSAVFVSIDCGATASYIDENSILWSVDEPYIQTGDNQVVQTPDHVMSTLRAFSTRKKNCYSIGTEKGVQVLVRASFYYGNYDKKSSPPTFDIHLDGNHWATVETLNDQLVFTEAIYVIKGDAISVCVAQTQPNQLPFMSALEVRSLHSSMYSHVDSNYALFLRRRAAFGTSKIVRYLDDPYDRIWYPVLASNGLTKVTSDASFISTTGYPDNPPNSVLQSAMTTSTSSGSIILLPNLPTSNVPIYINWYFSEVSQLDLTAKRSFEIYINNASESDPIIPPYGRLLEMYITNMTASSNTKFALEPTSDSTLPPLINAMEVFQVSDPLTDGTDSKDVEALAILQIQFSVLAEWSGDPCLPVSFTWEWVGCSSDATPRIIALYLGGFGLSEFLPDFSSMDALQTIDLHNNSLTGEIPDFLTSFTSLKELNLADNDFSGPIPSSLSKNNKLKLVVSGNKDLCVSGKSCKSSDSGTSTTPLSGTSTDPSYTESSKKSSSSKLPAILGATIPTFILFWVIAGVAAILHHKRKTATVAASSGGQMGGGPGKHSGQPQVQASPLAFNIQMPGMNNQSMPDDVNVTVEMPDRDEANSN